MTPYYSYIKDYIDASRITGLAATTGFVYLRYVNRSAEMYGVDVSGQVSLIEESGFGSLSASGMLNYVRGKSVGINDDLANIMPLNGKVAIEHQLSDWVTTVEVEMVAAKTKVSSVRNEVATSGYSLLNLRSQYQWKQVRFDFGVDNVLDKFYHHPLGGAYMGQGKTMAATTVPWGVLVPGMGRSFYLGMTVKM